MGNEGAIRLLNRWLVDESGYDERVWPSLKTGLEQNRLSFRELEVVKQSIYEEAAERDKGICQDCDIAADHIHHIVRRGYWGKNAKHRGEVVENLICLCAQCHWEDAHTKAGQRRHLTLLRDLHAYVYDEQPFLGLLGEANLNESS